MITVNVLDKEMKLLQEGCIENKTKYKKKERKQTLKRFLESFFSSLHIWHADREGEINTREKIYIEEAFYSRD